MFEFACGPNTGITMSEINDLLEELDLDGNSLLDYNGKAFRVNYLHQQVIFWMCLSVCTCL